MNEKRPGPGQPCLPVPSKPMTPCTNAAEVAFSPIKAAITDNDWTKVVAVPAPTNTGKINTL